MSVSPVAKEDQSKRPENLVFSNLPLLNSNKKIQFYSIRVAHWFSITMLKKKVDSKSKLCFYGTWGRRQKVS